MDGDSVPTAKDELKEREEKGREGKGKEEDEGGKRKSSRRANVDKNCVDVVRRDAGIYFLSVIRLRTRSRRGCFDPYGPQFSTPG